MKKFFSNLKWSAKDVVFNKNTYGLVFYDWKKAYKESVMGFFWVFIKPIFSVALFILGNIAINFVGNNNSMSIPYIFWLILGMLPWLFISDAANSSSTVIIQYSFLITKLKYNKHKIFFFTLMSRFLQHLVLMTLFFVAYVIVYSINWGESGNITGYPNITVKLTFHLFQLPLIAIIMFIFFYAWTFVVAQLSVISNDVRQVISLFVTGIFWLSGSFFDPNLLSGNLEWLKYLIYINPFASFLSLFRDSYVTQIWFFEMDRWIAILPVIIWSILLFGVGFWISSRTKEWFNDQV